jgi:hypothetical protein
MSDLLELRTRALALAERYRGVREHGGNNRGPQIERWQARVHLKPGDAWCTAFACCIVEDAAKGLGMESPLPMVGSVAKLFAWVMEHHPEWVSNKPTRGAIFIHFRDRYKPWSLGHCGFVKGVDDGHVLSIDGNTNDAGARDSEGGKDGVWDQRRKDDPGGYFFAFIDFGREGPAVR